MRPKKYNVTLQTRKTKLQIYVLLVLTPHKWHILNYIYFSDVWYNQLGHAPIEDCALVL